MAAATGAGRDSRSARGWSFVTFKGQPAALSPLDAVEVTLAPLGDSAEDQKKQDEIKPAELAAPEPPPPPPQAEKVEPVEAPPPVVAAPEAVPLPVEPPKPAPPPPQKTVVEKKPPPKPVETRQDRLREERKDREIAERRRKAQEARQELKRGAARMARRGRRRCRRRPMRACSPPRSAATPSIPPPRAPPESTGAVGVAFTIGPSGRVISQSITRSSGNPVLDAAARTTLSSVHTPPPPGGRFSTSTNIRFHFD